MQCISWIRVLFTVKCELNKFSRDFYFWIFKNIQMDHFDSLLCPPPTHFREFMPARGFKLLLSLGMFPPPGWKKNIFPHPPQSSSQRGKVSWPHLGLHCSGTAAVGRHGGIPRGLCCGCRPGPFLRLRVLPLRQGVDPSSKLGANPPPSPFPSPWPPIRFNGRRCFGGPAFCASDGWASHSAVKKGPGPVSTPPHNPKYGTCPGMLLAAPFPSSHR